MAEKHMLSRRQTLYAFEAMDIKDVKDKKYDRK